VREAATRSFPGAPETRLPKNLLHRLDPLFVLFPEN